MDNSNVNVGAGAGGQVQYPIDTTTTDTTQTQGTTATTNTTLSQDTITNVHEQIKTAAKNYVNSTSVNPQLPPPADFASAFPMNSETPPGGNLWTTPTGFVAVLMALEVVAAQMAKNALTDNSALVKGEQAQYEEGVDAGKMAKAEKDMEAMADIEQGCMALASAMVSFAGAAWMAKGSHMEEDPHASQIRSKEEMDGVETSYKQKMEPFDKEIAEQQEIKNNKDSSQEEIETANKKIKTATKKREVIQQEFDKEVQTNDDHKKASEKIQQQNFQTQQSDQQFKQQVVQGGTSLVQGLGSLGKAPFEIEEGQDQMMQQIYQTASQVMGDFVQALQQDMQSANQLIDQLNQLSQSMSNSNQQNFHSVI